jgi:peptidoglycan/LPS O-acetylase OafA/YrhL
MPELNTIRGIAVLMVMMYHGFYWGMDLARFAPAKKLFLTAAWTGRLGVNLFFVLSGFLITGLLIDTRDRTDYYKRFFIRRGLRILPPLLLVLIALLATRAAPLKFVLLSLVYLSNLTPLFGVAIAYPVLWSLAVEEHFYLVWPAVIHKLSNRATLVVCAAIVALSPITRLISFYLADRKGWVSYHIFDYTWNSADGLACGAFLAIFLREFQPSRKSLAKMLILLLAVAAGIWIVGFPFGILTRRLPAGGALQIVPWNLAFVALLGFFLLLGSSPWKRWSRSPVLEFLGDISYGLYLYHLLVLLGIQWLNGHGAFQKVHMDPFWGLWLRFLMLMSASVLVAYLSRRYFEEPILRLKSRWT